MFYTIIERFITFKNIHGLSKHNNMEDQVTFLIPNPGLRLVTTLLVSHLHVFHVQYGQDWNVDFHSCQARAKVALG
jgi:hypothetical protein